ncbi:sulfatase-like hydrolase/transferase [Spartinivicinus poritis]|uniref:Sulfatase-like hydrolase/transferase n=1 Tax=Spartinivicinus poritis TaxID=2994640 RepID=A0ABT5UHZ6_9GAMM|nr:sulfatase-like hydrolase/transferase [Spartinivicinus sp. A2-2]MDE1466012.1 sulfatase-like hydrolase/transferase [Spartinivicinus sp. A2-2]
MSDSNKIKNESKPNILLIMVDQMRFPIFGKAGGFNQELKSIIGFQDNLGEDNSFKDYFPGLMALRNNAVVLNQHRISSSACVPSRAALFTGQYPNKTEVKYTDGIFKDGTSKNYPWLDPTGYPTIGDWMRANDYNTHYIGK